MRSNIGWVLTSWALALFFLTLSIVTDNDKVLSWAIWLLIGSLWLYIALLESTKYIRYLRRNRRTNESS